jgi:hypothetical protein
MLKDVEPPQISVESPAQATLQVPLVKEAPVRSAHWQRLFWIPKPLNPALPQKVVQASRVMLLLVTLPKTLAGAALAQVE